MKSLLTIKDLAVSYGNKTIIENINFKVEEGDFLVIFGENGSGKSTLIKTLLGLKSPSSGEIIFENGLCHSDLGYLPQMTAEQKDFPASSEEVVLSGTLNRLGFKPFYGKKEKALCKKSMEMLSVYDLRKESFRNLSGGQKQRVLLARALCSAGKLILLDEPVSGLDPVAAADFYDAITRINESGITVIMVSHDIKNALSVATHVLDISEHTVVFFGTSKEYQERAEA